MAKFIDAHCHLQNISDISETLDVAGGLGIEKCICDATSPSDWSRVINLSIKYPAVRGCIGIHPWYIKDITPNWPTQMRETLAMNPDLMIGECGLDSHYPGPEQQLEIFCEQMLMAHELGRTIWIHCVGAWDKILNVINKNPAYSTTTIVLHGFYASPQILEQLIIHPNIYFSYSPRILQPNLKHATKIIQNTPLNKILVESDGTSPAVVIDVVNHIATIKSIASDKMADIIYNNTKGIL